MNGQPVRCCTRNDNGGYIARLDFCGTKIGRVAAPTSHSSIAPGATVHQCTPLVFIPSISKPLNPFIAYGHQ